MSVATLKSSNYSHPRIVDCPNLVDCLCGQNTTFGRHPGNRIFRKQIKVNLPRFIAARTKSDKMKITKSILDFMKRQGSRFLKASRNGSWIEIEKHAARDKVSHALRFAAKQSRQSTDEDSAQPKQSEDENSVQSQATSAHDVEQYLSKRNPIHACTDTQRSVDSPVPTVEEMIQSCLPVTKTDFLLNEDDFPAELYSVFQCQSMNYLIGVSTKDFYSVDPTAIDLSSDEIDLLIDL